MLEVTKRSLLDKLLVIRACEHVARDAMDRTNPTTANWRDVQNAMAVIADNAQQVATIVESEMH